MTDIELMQRILNAMAAMTEGVELTHNQRGILDELIKDAAQMLIVNPYKGD